MRHQIGLQQRACKTICSHHMRCDCKTSIKRYNQVTQPYSHKLVLWTDRKPACRARTHPLSSSLGTGVNKIMRPSGRHGNFVSNFQIGSRRLCGSSGPTTSETDGLSRSDRSKYDHARHLRSLPCAREMYRPSKGSLHRENYQLRTTNIAT